MLPPPHVQQRDPQELLCEVENDKLSLFLWSLGTSIAQTVRKLRHVLMPARCENELPECQSA